MKNKKILAFALAAALAITAVLPTTASAAALKPSKATITGTLAKEQVETLNSNTTTQASIDVNGSSVDYLTITVTSKGAFSIPATSKGAAHVYAFGTGMDGVTFKMDEANATDPTNSDMPLLSADSYLGDAESSTLTVTLPNSDGAFEVYVYIGYAEIDELIKALDELEAGTRKLGDPLKGFAVKKITYNVTEKSSGGSSGGGSGSGSSSTSKTETLADGSKKVTTVTKTATGTVTTVTTTAKDGTVTTIKTVENKDGSGSVTETVKYTDGSSKSTELVTDKTGKAVSVTCSRTSAGGETTVKTYSASGSKLTLKDVDSTKSSLIIPGKVKIDGKTFKVVKIGASALAKNTSLKKISITKNVTSIGKNAFKSDSKLKTVAINGKVTSVGKNAFSGINKKATFKIKASKSVFKTVKAAIKKQSGVAKTVKYKRV